MGSLSKSDQTRTKLLDAVEQLSATGPMSAITMRAIAYEAECSLGLAYRYFATKEEMLGAVLDRTAAYITDGLDPSHPPQRLAREAWKRMAERPAFVRLLAWMILERDDVTDAMSGHPFVQIAELQAESAGDPDPKAAASALAIIVLGGGLFAPAANRAAGNQPGDDAVHDRLIRASSMIQSKEAKQ